MTTLNETQQKQVSFDVHDEQTAAETFATGAIQDDPIDAAEHVVETEESARVLEALETLIEQGKQNEAELKEQLEMGLAPGRVLQKRRKSRELKEQCIALLEPSLERVFKSFDKDGSGTLDGSELRAAFEAAGRPASDRQIQKCVKQLDQNGDGVIDLNEFKQLTYMVATRPVTAMPGKR